MNDKTKYVIFAVLTLLNLTLFISMSGSGKEPKGTTVSNKEYAPKIPTNQNEPPKYIEKIPPVMPEPEPEQEKEVDKEDDERDKDPIPEPELQPEPEPEPEQKPEEHKNENSKKPHLETCLRVYNRELKQGNYDKVVNGLTKFMTIEPTVGINAECKPPSSKFTCSDYKYALGEGTKKAKKERKVAFLIQFGFDVDMLEAFLWEVYDVVDKFFITESVVTHSNRQIRKPLVWDMVKGDARFERFKDKIVHFIVDDSDVRIPNGDIWVSERNQEYIRWKEFLKWNEYHREFEETDVIGFGDTDEIVSRDVILALKKCTGDITTLDVASIFFMGDNKTAFPTDWPVHPYAFSYGDPTFYTIRSAKEYERQRADTPSRRKGQGDKHVFGGAHISPYMYLPYIVNKFIVATEYNVPDIPEGDIDYLDNYFVKYIIRDFEGRVRPVDQVWDELKEIHFIPWFIKCNPDRFPRFYGKKDPRIYLTKDQLNFECV